ncbi:hypothetical protein DACRYDRAFT_117981 [Dacryopinax primogenitus]|uniref:Uncharacterized protein n=1 Tax=Dacryopinax primogenitus (strain DJM 731) TaxID=1858805 RepID=M5FUQ5_DACPD|nr:uncharacterized protein DACRYDRAFT_117981 [Dacryopinax primogenitus]EJT99214.1 hypothetical protein DACRYDRAFT_117981 [Dacryopinax primogenitus]
MSYMILGRPIASEYLAIGTFLLTGVGAWAATRKSAVPPAAAGAKIIKPAEVTVQGASKEEEEFIRQFVAEAEKEDKAHH